MHPAIEKEIKILQTKIETLQSWNAAAELAESIKASLPQELFNGPYVSGEISVGIQQGVMEGILFKFYPTHTDQIAPVLRKFAMAGYHVKGEPDDYHEINRRTWLLKSEDNPAPINVMAFFESGKEGQVCKFVQVGVEEKPIYELKCEEAAQ